MNEYVNMYPDMAEFIEVFKILFKKLANYDPVLPIIVVEEEDSAALSRIFSTLNNTGMNLTSFEIAVSNMFGQGVDLIEDIEIGAVGLSYYPNMDPTKEIVLQTALLLAGKDPKKSRIPKNLNKEIWEKYKDQAMEALDSVGKFLTDELGFGLDHDNKLVPYDTLFAPLAFAWANFNFADLSASQKGVVNNIIKYYVVASCLHTRFTEGTNNKQQTDARLLLEALQNGDEKGLAPELYEKYGKLRQASPKGAIGKIITCLLRRESLPDPLTGDNIGKLPRDEIQEHHIWPTNYVTKNIPDWPKNESVNFVGNICLTSKETNSEFSNKDPAVQIKNSEESLGKSKMEGVWSRHLVNSVALGLMKKPDKNAADFNTFLKYRTDSIAEFIKREYGLELADSASQEDMNIDTSEQA